MKPDLLDPLTIAELRSSSSEAIRTGWIVRISQQGRATVDFEHNPRGPLEARTLIERLPQNRAAGSHTGLPVLLVFDGGDPGCPIIVGFLHETFDPTPGTEFPPARIVLEAAEEIVLRSGDSSLSLQANGDVVTKGTRLVSRASRTNKIRGALVSIN
jgi:hypothetical protein